MLKRTTLIHSTSKRSIMKNHFAWVEFIRQRTPSLINAHFELGRQYWQLTKGKTLFKEDGYYSVSALTESHHVNCPIDVHILSIDHQKEFKISLFDLFWGMADHAIDLHAYLHSSQLNLLRSFALHLEERYAIQDKRPPRICQTNRTPIEAILFKSQYHCHAKKPYGFLYCIQ